MKRYYSVDEISTDIGISRQQLTERIKKLGLDTKKLTKDDIEIIKDDSFDVLDGKTKQKAILDVANDNLKKQSLVISDIKGATYEQRYKEAKKKLDIVTELMGKCEKSIYTVGMNVKSTNGNASQNPDFKSYIELLKQFNALNKTINELEEKLKLTSTSIKKAIDD